MRLKYEESMSLKYEENLGWAAEGEGAGAVGRRGVEGRLFKSQHSGCAVQIRHLFFVY